MTRDEIELSRRTVLGALGTIGVTAAGSGLGTSAYLSDEEVFKQNTLTAGSLDLKLAWQEHYSDWSEDEAEYASMADGEPDYVLPGGPDAEDIALAFNDAQGFMKATAVEAYPDLDDDGLNDYSTLDEDVGPEDVGDICEVGADTPEDMDPRDPPADDEDEDEEETGTGTGLRTYRDRATDPPIGTATIDTDVEDGPEILPLIALDDVKPGDFGEVTFSLHLCNNPGYVWLFADEVAWAENGHTEPESKDVDSEGPTDESGSTAGGDSLAEAQVEILDAIQARAWYDVNGNNRYEESEPLIVGPDSLRSVLSTLRTNPGVQLDASKFFGVTDEESTSTSDDSIPDSGTFDCRVVSGNPDCADLGYDLGVRFDESVIEDGELSAAVSRNGTTYEVFVDVSVVEWEEGQPKTITWENLEVSVDGGAPQQAGAGAVTVKGGPDAHVCTPTDPAEPVSGAGDQEFQAPLTNNGSRPAISHFDICIAEIGDGDDGTEITEGGDRCLQNSTTVSVGFEWWVPIDHGNEIQTDSVAFDLGFYTEQCRHNDGSGAERPDQDA